MEELKSLIEPLARVASPLWGLAGVWLGWFLNQRTVEGREKKRVEKLQNMLKGELASLLCQLPDKRDIIRRIISSLDAGKLLPGESVHALRVVYDHYGPELFEYLDDKERNCLHVVYEGLRVLDRNLDAFCADFMAARANETYPDPRKAFKSRFGDLDRTCAELEELIKGYLKGQPVDVFETRRRDV